MTGYVRKDGEDTQFEELKNRILNAIEQRQTAKKYELLFDNMPELLAYIDEDGVIRTVNPAMAEAYGIPESELVG
ncbi:MAG: PAS domain S-box protein, partial [Halobaculum sp.]